VLEQAEACVVSSGSQGAFFGTGNLPRRRRFCSFCSTNACAAQYIEAHIEEVARLVGSDDFSLAMPHQALPK
jgi:hypothetical protein